MRRSETKIGQKVKLTPKWTNKDLPPPKKKVVYIIENHNPRCAGVSSDPKSKSCYGVFYTILSPIGLVSQKTNEKVPMSFVQVLTGRSAEYIIKRFEKWKKKNKTQKSK